MKPLTLMAKLMRPLGAMMRSTMRKCMERDMDALQALAEGRPVAASTKP